MLALTDNASTAIEGILSSPEVRDGAGIRIAPPEGEDASSAAQLHVMVTGAPAETDQVIDDSGARVFVDESLAVVLDDKLLDAGIVEDQVHFMLGAQGAPHPFEPGADGSGDV